MSQDLGRKTVVKVEVVGMGGVGKTQLVCTLEENAIYLRHADER